MSPPSGKLTREQSRYAARGAPLVRALARVASNQWRTVIEDDFVSVGEEALVLAARRFDPDRGAPFETFARPSVWGAMLDLAHREVFVVQHVGASLSRVFADDGLADGSVQSWMMHGEAAASPSDEALGSLRARAAELVMATVTAQVEAPTPEEEMLGLEDARASLRRARDALETLSPTERDLVRVYFEETRTLDQVAELRGVSKRTVQRDLDRIKARLAEALQAQRTGGTPEG